MAIQVAPENVVGRDQLISRIWRKLRKNSLRFTAERRIGCADAPITCVGSLFDQPHRSWRKEVFVSFSIDPKMVEDGSGAGYMSGRASISTYTPSNTDPAILRRIFVQREKLLERIVDRLSRSVTTGDKHHILLIGPRGSGKTHLVSLAAWELQQSEKLQARMRIAWLGEDDSFTRLIHLAFGIAKQLAEDYPEEFPSDFKTAVRGLPPDDAALSVLRSVVERLEDRSLILITENMDQTFRGLGDAGQKKWRAFLQETRRIATLATSQQLFAGVFDRKEAFFGFFDIQHLEPLSVDEAGELIRRISVEQGKAELGEYLNSAEGRYRIRALHYLAGGNHRMYVLLAEFLTKDSLDDLVAAFEELAHDMTPYFQERMRSLPDQQRQLAQCLCDAEGALTVKQIAEETFVDERSCSKQLGNLKGKGYVRSEKRGKESYYDMAEPLMRLCLEVKNQRGRPLKLVARFLKAWFPATTLHAADPSHPAASRADAYRLEAASCSDYFQTVIAEQLDGDIGQCIRTGKLDTAKYLVGELQFADAPSAVWWEARLASQRGNHELEISKLSELIEMDDAPPEQRARALVNRGVSYRQHGDVERALSDYSAVIEMDDASPEERALALNNRGKIRWRNEEFEASTSDFQTVLSITAASDEQRTKALFALLEPVIAHCDRAEVIAALKRAFAQGDRESDTYGGTPQDLLRMVLRRSSSEWADYIADIAALFRQYDAAEKLGQGITQSIRCLDEGDLSWSQIDAWNSAWQEAGKDCEDLEIPLRCLDAAVEVMKSDPKTDRPLFRLPLEIRRLVRPLLDKSLGEASSK